MTLCKFIDNVADPLLVDGFGGGVWTVMFRGAMGGANSIAINNCLFGRNTAKTDGGGLHIGIWGGGLTLPSLADNTFSDNTATNGSGGGIYHTEIRPVLRNCILWGNTDSGGTDASSQIHSNAPGFSPDAKYTDWQGHIGGTGNINADPLFEDPTGSNGNPDDDFRIGDPLSLVIDAGDNIAIPPGLNEDLDGSPRIVNAIVDMGAHEVQCLDVTDCADLDANGITDDVCTWWECAAGACNGIPKVYPSDMGSALGACPLDTFCGLPDSLHALTCFQATNPCDKINIDAGGALGACAPDGFCNLADALHALTCFQGTNTCTCARPLMGGPPEPSVVGVTELVAVPAPFSVSADINGVRIFAKDPLVHFRAYQLHVEVSGGLVGQFELVDITIEDRADYVFAGAGETLDAFNVTKGQMINMMIDGDAATGQMAYLATFTYRVSSDAVGTFVVDILHDEANQDQTFLVGAEQTDKIEVVATTPGVMSASSP